MAVLKLSTDAEAARLVGRRIVRVETRPFTEDDREYTDPVIILDDGSRISFQAHALEEGDAVTMFLATQERPNRPEKKPGKAPVSTALATFRKHLKTLDKYATVTPSLDGFIVRTNRFWSDGRRWNPGKSSGAPLPDGVNGALNAFLPGCPNATDVRHTDIEEGRNGRHVWYVTVAG